MEELPPLAPPKPILTILSQSKDDFDARYEVLDEIGRGGFSVVYRCRNKLNGVVEISFGPVQDDHVAILQIPVVVAAAAPEASAYQWLPCHLVAGGLSKDLYRSEENDDFEDSRVRILCYYVSEWYKQCDVDDVTSLVLMNGFYVWLTEEKPTLRDIAKSSDMSSFALYLLGTFSAAAGDSMGGAELVDIEYNLKNYIDEVNAPPVFVSI